MTRTARILRFGMWTAFPALFSFLCLAWALRGANLQNIRSDIFDLSRGWVACAIVSDICVYSLHAWRWKLLLTPIRSFPFARAIHAIYVSLFVNEVFPFRPGELVRCFLLSGSTGIPLPTTLASAVIERLFDGVWLIVGVFWCLRMNRLPETFARVSYLGGLTILALALLLGVAIYGGKKPLKVFGVHRVSRWLATLVEELDVIGHSRYLYYSFLVSGLYMMAQFLPIWLIVRAGRLDIPWVASMTLVVLLRLGSIVPQAPGNLGSFQLVTAQTMIFFGLATAHASRFALILWAVLHIPLASIGFVALILTGMNPAVLRRAASAAAADARNF